MIKGSGKYLKENNQLPERKYRNGLLLSATGLEI